MDVDILAMASKGSYYEEYLRKHGALPVTRQMDDKFIADREAYIKFLEAQLQRVTAAVAHVDSLSEKMTDQQAVIDTQSTQIVDLQDKVVKMTQLIQTVQQYSERQGKEAGLAVGNLHAACSRLGDRIDGHAEELRTAHDLTGQVQARVAALETDVQAVSGQVQHSLQGVQSVQHSVREVSQQLTKVASSDTVAHVIDAVQKLDGKVDASLRQIEEARSAAYEAAHSASHAADVSAGAEAAALAAGEQAAAAAAAAAHASSQAGAALERAGEAAILASSAEASVRSTVQLAVRTLGASPQAANIGGATLQAPQQAAQHSQGWSSLALPSQISGAVHGSLLTYERGGAGASPVGMTLAVGQAVERSVTAILHASTAEISTVQRSLLTRIEAAEEGCKRALSSQTEISRDLSLQVESAVSGMQQQVRESSAKVEAQLQAFATTWVTRAETAQSEVRGEVQQCVQRVHLLEHSIGNQTKAVFAEVTADVKNRMGAIEAELAALRSAHGYTAKGLEADMQQQLALLRRECLEAVHACREGLGQVTQGLGELEGTVQRMEQEAALNTSGVEVPGSVLKDMTRGRQLQSPSREGREPVGGGGPRSSTAGRVDTNMNESSRLESRLESRAASSLASAAVEAATERMRLALGGELAELAGRVAEADGEYRALIARLQAQVEKVQADVQDVRGSQGQQSISSETLLAQAKTMIQEAESALHTVASDAIRTCASIADSAAELLHRAETAGRALPQTQSASTPSSTGATAETAAGAAPPFPASAQPPPGAPPSAPAHILPSFHHTGTFAAVPASSVAPASVPPPSPFAEGRITELLNGLAVLTREVSTIQQGHAVARGYHQQQQQPQPGMLDISSVSLGGPLQSMSSASLLHSSGAVGVQTQAAGRTQSSEPSASQSSPLFSTAQGKKPVLRPVGPLSGTVSKSHSTPPKQGRSPTGEDNRPASSRQSPRGESVSPSTRQSGGPPKYASLPAWYQQRAAEIAQSAPPAGAFPSRGGRQGLVSASSASSSQAMAGSSSRPTTAERRKSRSQANEQEERHALEHALATSSIHGHLTSALGSILSSARHSAAAASHGAHPEQATVGKAGSGAPRAGTAGLQARGPSPQERDSGSASATGRRRLSTGSQASQGSTSVHVSGIKLGRLSSGRGE